MKNREVIKHSSAIQISNNVTLLQRRAWNVLLANAFDDLLNNEEFNINLSDLYNILGYESHNDKHLKLILKDLVETSVEWNVLNKDRKNEWGTAALLAQVQIINGVVIYGYAPIMRKRLYNPAMYARISLSLQNKFNSKYTLALYELFVDYYRVKDRCGETPYLSIKQFKKLLGLKKNEYELFKDLNKFIIKKAIKEINDKSDLFIEAEYKRVSRRIVAVKFRIKKNDKNTIEIKAIEQKILAQKSLPTPNNEPEIYNQKLFKTLTDEFGISNNKTADIIKTKDEFYINEILTLVREHIKAGIVKNIPAYTISAIENDYRAKKPEHEIEKERIKEQKRKKQKEKKLIEQLRQDFNEQYYRKAEDVISKLSKSEKEKLQNNFERDVIKNANTFAKRSYTKNGFKSLIFVGYVANNCLPEEDTNFKAYAKQKGYDVIEYEDGKYKFA